MKLVCLWEEFARLQVVGRATAKALRRGKSSTEGIVTESGWRRRL
jgi:hypothetical protein